MHTVLRRLRRASSDTSSLPECPQCVSGRGVRRQHRPRGRGEDQVKMVTFAVDIAPSFGTCPGEESIPGLVMGASRLACSRCPCCRQIHLTRDFSHALCTSDCVHTHCMAQDEPRVKGVFVRVSFHPHVIHDVICLSVRWSFLVSLSLLFLSVFHLFSFTLFLFSVRHTISNVDTAEG